MKNFLVTMIFLSFACQSIEDLWQLKKDKDNVKVYQKQLDGYKLKHHKATTIINVGTEVILAVLQDSEACPLWVHDCKVSQLVETIDLTHGIFYTNIAAPLLIKDRDMYLKSEVDFAYDGSQFIITLTSLPAYKKEHKNRVRVENVNMVWTINKLAEAKTQVIYEVYIDPKIPLKSFVNHSITSSVIKTMQGLRDIVKLKKYHQ